MPPRSACPPGTIRNPATGRCVSVTGRIGRALLGGRRNNRTPPAAAGRGVRLNDLPTDLLEHIANRMNTRTKAQLARTSRYHRATVGAPLRARYVGGKAGWTRALTRLLPVLAGTAAPLPRGRVIGDLTVTGNYGGAFIGNQYVQREHTHLEGGILVDRVSYSVFAYAFHDTPGSVLVQIYKMPPNVSGPTRIRSDGGVHRIQSRSSIIRDAARALGGFQVV